MDVNDDVHVVLVCPSVYPVEAKSGFRRSGIVLHIHHAFYFAGTHKVLHQTFLSGDECKYVCPLVGKIRSKYGVVPFLGL